MVTAGGVCDSFVGINDSVVISETIECLPNRVSRILTLQIIKPGSSIHEIQIYNSKGEIVVRKITEMASVKTAIDVSCFSNGVYYYKVKMLSGKTFVGRIIKI